jgi:Rrf2 family protein
MMTVLAKHFNNGQLISARQLASDGHFSYQLGCKLLQKLHQAELVKSGMGPKGGFTLNREPSKITLLEIIKALQGEIRLNRCLPGGDECEFESDCEINTKLSCLQLYINGYLNGITLAEVMVAKGKR